MYSGSKTGEKYMDGWDGYPIEREKLIKYIESKEIHNTVFVTGDYHRAIALESDRNGTASSNDNIAVELIVSSITSANDDEYFSKEEAVNRHERYLTNNPHMKYCNNTENGYLILEINMDEIKVNYVIISSIKTPNGITSVEKTFVIESDKHELITR
jgi:alkaline phosphatase D